jgi:hypothetical protein
MRGCRRHDIRKATPASCYLNYPPGKFSEVRDKILALRWSLARLAFIIYIVFSVVTLIGGFLTAPLMTWYFFDDWRFWRHWRAGLGLLPHGLRMTAMMLGHSRAFMFSVPLASPPRSDPDPSIALNRADWHHGDSCGGCFNCCTAGGNVCPLLDKKQQACRGYNSFYWRYFNCGRYPSFEEEIHYYDCRKWALTASGQTATTTLAVNAALNVSVGAVRREECL